MQLLEVSVVEATFLSSQFKPLEANTIADVGATVSFERVVVAVVEFPATSITAAVIVMLLVPSINDVALKVAVNAPPTAHGTSCVSVLFVGVAASFTVTVILPLIPEVASLQVPLTVKLATLALLIQVTCDVLVIAKLGATVSLLRLF